MKRFEALQVFYMQLLLICFFFAASCRTIKPVNMTFSERQLTSGEKGHTINPGQVFSPDDQWIVYDTRNDDTMLKNNGSVEMVNVHSGKVKQLYATNNQSEYGPGAGAATFSPSANRVLFLHGIRNADASHPYDFTRRTGVAIDTDHPFHPIFADARNTVPPFTPGALRGGTHAHSWSADGKWISCTYNDYVLQQLSHNDSSVRDLRTVAVMAPLHQVTVPSNGLENNDGELFSAVVVRVTAHPLNGSDEIDRAFDETWIGDNGYLKADSTRQHRAIAFQGNVRDRDGNVITEIFVADIPDDISKASADGPLEGTDRTMPVPPFGTTQRRVSHLAHGVQGPRHWLRSTSDGSAVAFLARDTDGIVQVFSISPNGGPVSQLTSNRFPVQGQFNFSPDNRYLAYIADNSVFVNDLHSGKAERVTKRFSPSEAPVNAAVWSKDGKSIAYDRYTGSGSSRYLQIFLLQK